MLASYRNSVMGMGFVTVLLTVFNWLNHETLLFHLAVPIPSVYLPNSATYEGNQVSFTTSCFIPQAVFVLCIGRVMWKKNILYDDVITDCVVIFVPKGLETALHNFLAMPVIQI